MKICMTPKERRELNLTICETCKKLGFSCQARITEAILKNPVAHKNLLLLSGCCDYEPKDISLESDFQQMEA